MKKHMGKLGRVTMNKRKGLNMEQKRNLTGWAFLLPASILIFVFCFYPMVQAPCSRPGLPTMHVS